jgi:hypothetical protein
MGIDLDIKNRVLGPTKDKKSASLQYAAAAWVHAQVPEMSAFPSHEERIAKRYVWLDDYLIRFRAIDTSQLYTLEELFARFWEPVRRSLMDKQSTCSAYVMICDDRVNVPKSKAPTQIKRAQASSRTEGESVPYPAPHTSVHMDDSSDWVTVHSEWQLVPGGIRYSTDFNTVEEKIDLRRLRLSDRSGKKLWLAFLPLIETAMREDCPEGRYFIFDFDATGAHWFDSDGNTVVAKEPHHALGETDPALIWWTEYVSQRHFMDDDDTNLCSAAAIFGHIEDDDCYAQTPMPDMWTPPQVHIRTTDTDVIPLFCLYYAKTKRTMIKPSAFGFTTTCLYAAQSFEPRRLVKGQGIFWHNDVRSGSMIDLDLMAESIKLYSGLTLGVFALFCISCGNCDYVPAESKALYAKGSGVLKILDAFQKMPKSPDDSEAVLYARFVRMLHTLALNKDATMPYSLERLRQPTSKPKFVPRDDDVVRIGAEVVQNYEYWRDAI